MSKHQILYVRKTDRLNPHERIEAIGGRNQDGSLWTLTQKAAIEGMEGGKWEFFVHRGGYSVDVIVATSRYGNKYLKTRADGEHPDNLLSLPEIP